jgi:dihydroorotate dehydrogenase
MFYQIFRSLLFKFDAETIHNLTINFLKFCPQTATVFCCKRDYENLHSKIWNIDFSNPLGMAAGFDKNAQIALTLFKFGFGFVECGTVTVLPQQGNPKPRIFRLFEDRAIINRLGFNNLGALAFAQNIETIAAKIPAPLAVNIGKNEAAKEALPDYLLLLEKFYLSASYIAVNISSPNTKNLRDLEKESNLDVFLSAIMKKKNELKNRSKKNTPIVLKISPDLVFSQQEKIAEIIVKNAIDGLIIANSTVDRQLNLSSKYIAESGGLSGPPLFKKSNEVLKNFYKLTGGKIVLIGSGGVSCAADAYEKIKCGASLIQIYTALVYHGPGLVEKIKKDLSAMIKKDGFKKISEAVGVANNI